MHTLLPGSGFRPLKRKVNVLVYLTAKIGPEVLPHLLHRNDVNLRIVSDCSKAEFQEYTDIDLSGLHWIDNAPIDPYKNQKQMLGHKLARWADMLFTVADAGMVGLVLAGLTTDVMLHAIRCWDISKRILMLPELSVEEHKSPVWRRQLAKIHRKCEWIQVLEPALWKFKYPVDVDGELIEVCELEVLWQGFNEVLEALHTEARIILRRSRATEFPLRTKKENTNRSALPPEIWTQIFDELGDWEVATALSIYTHLPTPSKWHGLVPPPGSKKKPTLEWVILTKPINHIKSFFEAHTKSKSKKPLTLSAISLDIIFRFARTDVLTYLASDQKDIFWTSFSSGILPHKASCIYNSPAILQWWKDCPSVIKKEYESAAIDGASRAGFIEVLQWWLDSGLPLQYTERALENASSRGLVEVLEWWHANNAKLQGTSRELPLKVGKSIWLAAQCGRAQSIAWWERSGIPYSHEERVATVASQGGHVEVLDLWYSLKGSKMIFDNQVLVGPTKHGHANVLEWWKDATRKWGLRVEYKTCDIEEAMEDAVGGGGEGEVREWWARNGLNLGVGTGEWMKVKTL